MSFWKKLQKFQKFGKNWENLINLVNCFAAFDLIETIYVRIDIEIEFKLCFKRHHVETLIQKLLKTLGFSKIFKQNFEIRQVLARFELESGLYNALNSNKKAHNS